LLFQLACVVRNNVLVPHVSELIGLYTEQGLSLSVIGRRFGHTADWVRFRLVAAGVPLRPPGRQPTITDDQVRSLLDQGLRVAEIASELGVSDSSVLDRMRAHGWTGPPRRPRGPSRNASPSPKEESLRQLYVTEGLTVAEVAHRLGQSHGRVTAALHAAGIARRRPGWTDGTPPAPITAEQLTELYVENGKTVREVAAILNTTTTRVNAALRRHGIPRRPEPQKLPPPLELDKTTLTELYVSRRLGDDAIGLTYGVPAYRVTMRRRELGVHRPPAPPPHPEPPVMPPLAVLHRWYVTEGRTLEQIAHQHHTSPHKRDGDRALRRLTALYQDPDVTALLRQHRIPERPVAGTITQRFPTPTPISRSFLTTAYGEIGLATAHIEQLTGQPAERILQLLHDRNIPVRPSGSQSPWLRRQRDL
jgi:transposase-like protein